MTEYAVIYIDANGDRQGLILFAESEQDARAALKNVTGCEAISIAEVTRAKP